VVFDIDANGILQVTAKDKASGRNQSIRIEGSTGISKEEVERMKKEADLHAEEDRKRRELVDAKNNADALLYTAEKALKDGADKVSAEVKQEVEEKTEALKKIKDQDTIEDIRQAAEALSQALQKIGAEMYKQKPEQGQEPESGPEQPKEN